MEGIKEDTKSLDGKYKSWEKIIKNKFLWKDTQGLQDPRYYPEKNT